MYSCVGSFHWLHLIGLDLPDLSGFITIRCKHIFTAKGHQLGKIGRFIGAAIFLVSLSQIGAVMRKGFPWCIVLMECHWCAWLRWNVRGTAWPCTASVWYRRCLNYHSLYTRVKLVRYLFVFPEDIWKSHKMCICLCFCFISYFCINVLNSTWGIAGFLSVDIVIRPPYVINVIIDCFRFDFTPARWKIASKPMLTCS